MAGSLVYRRPQGLSTSLFPVWRPVFFTGLYILTRFVAIDSIPNGGIPSGELAVCFLSAGILGADILAVVFFAGGLLADGFLPDGFLPDGFSPVGFPAGDLERIGDAFQYLVGFPYDSRR